MSRSRSNAVPPHAGHVSPSGMNSATGRSYQASAPCTSKTPAARSTSAGVKHRLAALRAVNRRDRHSPRALARDAPVGTVGDHVREPLAAPRWQPLDLCARRLSSAARAQAGAGSRELAVHPDEPLRRGQEDDRVVTPPAVRIRMLERLVVPQPSPRLERLDDDRIGVEHALAVEELDRVEEMSARADRRVDLEAVLHAGREVVAAVARRGMHGARALLERHVFGENADRLARVERVLEAQVLELRALHLRDWLAERPPGRLRYAWRQRFGEDHRASVDVIRGVIEVGMKCDRQVRRNRPRRRRPDEHRDRPSRERGHPRGDGLAARRRQRELDVDRRRRVILVLDFSFGERRAAVDAPMDRLLALVDEPLLDELAERPRDRRLVR